MNDVVQRVGDRVLDDVEHAFEGMVVFVGDVAPDRIRRGAFGRITGADEHLDQPDAVADPVVEPAVDVSARVVALRPGHHLELPQRMGAVEWNRELVRDVRTDRFDATVVEDDLAHVPVEVEVGVVLPHPVAITLDGDLGQDSVLVNHPLLHQLGEGRKSGSSSKPINPLTCMRLFGRSIRSHVTSS